MEVKGPRVLMVDDDQELCHLVISYLREDGFDATAVHSGAHALQLMRNHQYDVVVLDLLRDVSPELRSPLARAHAALSLVRQRPNEALDDNLDRVETELERVNGMIGRLLNFSRLDSGERPMQKEPVELAGLLHGIVQASRLEAEPSGKCVILHDDEPIVVPGDPELLARCLENVIGNAIRHTPANTAVEISLSRNNGTAQYCCVTVRDHGNGVSEPQLRRIFDPFYRVHPGGTDLNGGSGIGLAIAKRAVSWHEGSISAANAPDGGIIVSILLPMCRDNISGAIS
jgi:two-component system sensor histidine kinase CpxA